MYFARVTNLNSSEFSLKIEVNFFSTTIHMGHLTLSVEGHLQPYSIFDFELNFGIKSFSIPLHIQFQNGVYPLLYFEVELFLFMK